MLGQSHKQRGCYCTTTPLLLGIRDKTNPLLETVVHFYRKIGSVRCNSCNIRKIGLFYRKLTRSYNFV